MSSRHVQLEIILFAAFFIVSGQAIAEQIPELIDAYALKLEKECSSSSGNGNNIPERSPKLISLVSRLYGSIYVVDGAYTACSDAGPLCGTGGCPVGVFRVKNKSIETLYDEQAFSWDASRDAKSITMRIHGAFCPGGSGPDPCAIQINLATGKKRVFVPKN